MASTVVLNWASLRGMPARRPGPPVWRRGHLLRATRWQHLWTFAPGLIACGRRAGQGRGRQRAPRRRRKMSS
eukprot:10831950-Alexandrium_andersonii.AAC.1